MPKLKLFDTPVYVFRTKIDKDAINEAIQDCYHWRASSTGVSVSNTGGWHSDTTFFRREEASFQPIRSAILDAIAQATKDVSLDGFEGSAEWSCQGWININGSGALNAPHDHPGFLWSGVYYLKCPAGMSEKEGDIEFFGPKK